MSTLPQLCVSWTGSYRFWLSLLGSMCWEVCAAFSWLCKTDPSGRVHAIFKVQRHQSCPAGEADDASLNRSSWLILQQPPSHLPPPPILFTETKQQTDCTTLAENVIDCKYTSQEKLRINCFDIQSTAPSAYFLTWFQNSTTYLRFWWMSESRQEKTTTNKPTNKR